MTNKGQKDLYSELIAYSKSDMYPYHMPGHKRQVLGNLSEDILAVDITEIDGFDNLHNASGILANAQDKASALYQAEETFYLVNGSTCGILSAISATVAEGEKLLMSRDCHKSVYHAVYLRNLQVSYLFGSCVEGFDFHEAITPAQVEAALEQNPDAKAVLIVSPTYEGRIADVATIAELVHKKGIPLIVDEAHGAHLGMADEFAPNSCMAGADLVIHSVHKTLPAMTQTALLHVNGNLVNRNLLRRFLHIYQSSSPSYVLMSSIEDAIGIAAEKKSLFADMRNLYMKLVQKLQSCKNLKFIAETDYMKQKQDIGKLVIASLIPEVSGQWLYDTLREKYHLQCEMAAGSYCLAMFTIGDSKEGYDRMLQALFNIDESLGEQYGETKELVNAAIKAPTLFEPKVSYPLAQAWDMPATELLISEAINHVVAEFVNLYPPGIPLLVPGEVLTLQLYDTIMTSIDKKLNVQGISHKEAHYYIKVLCKI